jgi:ADP-ribose pyrophosphatase
MPDPPADDPWFDILDRQTRHRGFLRLDSFSVRQRLLRGGWTPPLNREVMIAPAAAAVLLFDPGLDRVVTIEQARLPAALMGFKPLSLEVVAGLIDAGESPEQAARREALEETGCSVLGEMLPIARMMTSPGNTAQEIHVFCARVDAARLDLYRGEADENEDIRVVALSYAEFIARLDGGGFENAITLVAAYWLARHIDSVRERWR